MANGDNARTLGLAAVEQMALNVFGLADRDGKVITRRMVAERLSELSAHSDGCRCGLCHRAVGDRVQGVAYGEPLAD